MESSGEIFVIPFFGTGHLNPAMELCRNISSHNIKTTLIIASHLSSSVPDTFCSYSPFIHVAEISATASEPGSETGNPLDQQNKHMGEGIKSFLSTRSGPKPTCAIVDIMMSWCKEIFVDHELPVVTFFTSGATFTALDHGRWKAKVGEMKPGEIRELPGLPTEMAVSFEDLSKGPRGRPGRPGPGSKPRWVDEAAGSVALLINTCDDLELVFIDYIAEQAKVPVWGVGPLLPQQFWKSAGSILHDHEMRSNHNSNYSEDEVIDWLETKPTGSVIYISFGSEVGPTMEEYKELAEALEGCNHNFIWVIQPGSGKTGIPRSFLGTGQPGSEEEEEGYYPDGLDVKVGNRGLIITGWAPQLLILSHPSTGGFLSHCGWNSTTEAIGRGVPILGWPINGDQFDNAKLVANHLKIGFVLSSSGKFKKEDIAAGIERLMSDDNVHKQAKELGKKFESGFPVSSISALGAFVEFITQKAT
ncbi:UDP-glucosyltransferase 29-like [Rutidosis leptorrhynchoides]|uniref:UDP-glucosyltransferase 29-like n=1 Tax=Rutidosis leptorrhynchoides TaxID=125765 RepID=UPI003A9A567A